MTNHFHIQHSPACHSFICIDAVKICKCSTILAKPNQRACFNCSPSANHNNCTHHSMNRRNFFASVARYHTKTQFVCLFVGCLTSQQHASVSQGRICTDNFTCCHIEIEAADPTFHLTQSQYTDTGPTSPSADPITPGAWQGSHWSANF